MNDRITLTGKIGFEPPDKTKKHKDQASWKKIAMIHFDGEISEYYAWFIQKRYNLTLNKPIRGAHISFINDSIFDLKKSGNRTEKEVEANWEAVKKKWDGKTIQVVLSVDPRTNGRIWWFNVPHDERTEIQSIRTELGLGKPYFGLHMSLGYANEKQIEHSQYIHELITKGFIK